MNLNYDKEKQTGMFFRTKDGRRYMYGTFSALLPTSKLLFIVGTLFLMISYLGGVFFTHSTDALNQRILNLESSLKKKVNWMVAHKNHFQSHLSSKATQLPDIIHDDGRKHLTTPPGSFSKLAELMSPNTDLPIVDDHYLCGENEPTENDVLQMTLAVAFVSWMAPLSLANSLHSWKKNGLLDIADEKIAFLNSATDVDRNLARSYGFDIYETDERNRNPGVGVSMAHIITNTSADVILFLEKDFMIDEGEHEGDVSHLVRREIYNGMSMLARGVDGYRLRGMGDLGTEGLPNCCLPDVSTRCPFTTHFESSMNFGTHMDWLQIFCDENILENSKGRVAKCTSEPNAPTSFCFSTGNSNWSNNPILFHSRGRLAKHLVNIGSTQLQKPNHFFEMDMTVDWLSWDPPGKVCTSISGAGTFIHKEIDQ